MQNSKSPNDLHPDIRMKYEEWHEKCSAEGLGVRITHTWRSPAYQNRLYAQGRTTSGRKVTNLTGLQSKHCFMLRGKPASKAFDFGVFTNGIYITNGGHPAYTRAGEIGEELGMKWGGRWKSPFDPGHLEII